MFLLRPWLKLVVIFLNSGTTVLKDTAFHTPTRSLFTVTVQLEAKSSMQFKKRRQRTK